MIWNTLYSDNNLKKWGLPASKELNQQGVVRDLVLTWTELQSQFRTLTPPPSSQDNIWYIVCDVLVLDDHPIVDDELYIFARRIEIRSDITFFIPNTANNLTIVTQEICHNDTACSVNAAFMPADDSIAPIIKELAVIEDAPATIFSLQPSEHLTRTRWSDHPSLQEQFGDQLRNGETLRLGMTTIYQLACLLADNRDSSVESTLSQINSCCDNLAIKQLEWVAAICDAGLEGRSLSAQARVQLGWLVKESQGLLVIPPLDFSVYNTSATSMLAVLKEVSGHYERLQTLEISNENWLKQVSLTVAFQANEVALQTQIEEQDKSKLAKAKRAEAQAAFQLRTLHNALVNSNFDFEVGLKIWKRHNEIKAALTLVVDIVKLTVSVGKLVAMAAAPGSSGITTGKEATASAQNISTDYNKIKNIAGQLEGVNSSTVAIVKDVGKIVEIGKTADAMHTLADDTLQKVNDAFGQTFTPSPLSGIDVVTGGKQVWQSLQVAVNDMLSIQEDTLNSIEGGAALRVAFNQLIIGAESYCSARLAVAEASNILVETKLRTDAAHRSEGLAQLTIQTFEKDQSLYQQLKQDAFNRLQDVKRGIYLQLSQYYQACQYFTLREPANVLPSITASTHEFISSCARVSGMQLVMNGLTPAPQTLNPLVIRVAIDDEQRNDRSLVVQLDLENEALLPYARVRIDKMQVGLFDTTGEKILVRKISIGSSGSYQDRIPGGGNAQFYGNPFTRTVTYDALGNVLLGGDVYARFSDVVFKPTPFSTWTFTLDNSELVQQAAELEITISGAASPA